MLLPNRVKYRKTQRGRIRGKAYKGSTVEFGSFGLKSMEHVWLTNRQIEAARIAINRFLKREGRMWIRIFPDKPVTKKPADPLGRRRVSISNKLPVAVKVVNQLIIRLAKSA